MKRSKKILMMICIMLVMTLIVPTQFSNIIGGVTTVEAATKVKLNKKKATVYVGETTTLKIKGTKAKVKWNSSNKKVATVNSKGKVTAKKKGTVTITAKVSGKKYTCKITVKNPYLSKTKISMDVKDTYILKLKGAIVKSFSSSNKKVATVNKKGKITAKKTGTAKITVRDTKGRKYICNITVKKETDTNEIPEKYEEKVEVFKYQSEMQIKLKTYEIEVGGGITLPAASVWSECKIYSQDTSIAKADGLVVKGISRGTTYIVVEGSTGITDVYKVIVV